MAATAVKMEVGETAVMAVAVLGAAAMAMVVVRVEAEKAVVDGAVARAEVEAVAE